MSEVEKEKFRVIDNLQLPSEKATIAYDFDCILCYLKEISRDMENLGSSPCLTFKDQEKTIKKARQMTNFLLKDVLVRIKKRNAMAKMRPEEWEQYEREN